MNVLLNELKQFVFWGFKFLLKVLIVLLIIDLSIALSLFIFVKLWNYTYPPKPNEAFTNLPESNASVGIQLESAHLFLAEYNRKIVFRNRNFPDKKLEMFPDTGGYLRAQLYRINKEQFFISGFFDNYSINVGGNEIIKDKTPVSFKGEYLGAFDRINNSRFKFYPASESAEQKLIPGEISLR